MSMAEGKEATLPVVQDRSLDDARLDRWLRAEMPRVARLLSRMLGPRQDLEDLVQTVFLELMRALPRFRGESSESTFIAGIAVRVARRAMRPTAFQRLRALMPAELASQRPDPERSYTDLSRLRRVQATLARIHPDKRIAFCLWAIEGLEPAQIAEITQASVTAVRSRIFYAQKALRAAAARDPLLREALEEVP